MIIKKKARPTLTAVEMEIGDVFEFTLEGGGTRTIELLETSAKVLFTTLKQLKAGERGGKTYYEFTCRIRLDHDEHLLRREVPTNNSFYEPWVIHGVRIWFDAVKDIFDFLLETHGDCKPGKQARFAFQDANLRICEPPLRQWCSLPARMCIDFCYVCDDCFLGPYQGASAHGGLDINHAAGTPIYAPLNFDDQYYFNSLAAGDNNNRHRAHHVWPDGSEWILQCHHMTEVLYEPHVPVKAGLQYAKGAGVLSGFHDHSHFVFRLKQDGEEFILDPWILFRQMYLDFPLLLKNQ